MALNEFGFQIFQIRVIETELPLERPIGQSPPALEYGYRLVEDLLKVIAHPSYADTVQQTVWEEEQPCGRIYTADG